MCLKIQIAFCQNADSVSAKKLQTLCLKSQSVFFCNVRHRNRRRGLLYNVGLLASVSETSSNGMDIASEDPFLAHRQIAVLSAYARGSIMRTDRPQNRRPRRFSLSRDLHTRDRFFPRDKITVVAETESCIKFHGKSSSHTDIFRAAAERKRVIYNQRFATRVLRHEELRGVPEVPARFLSCRLPFTTFIPTLRKKLLFRCY